MVMVLEEKWAKEIWSVNKVGRRKVEMKKMFDVLEGKSISQ